MVPASVHRDFCASAGPRIPREVLIELLGAPSASWFTDSSSTGFQLHLDWSCRCRARKAELTAGGWTYEPCSEHAGVALHT
jgi:hypothetical protein